MNIYLYIKQHQITGLKYFGKTKRDPYKYNGSGRYWKKHIKKHGVKHINTLQVFSFSNQEQCSKFALDFSIQNNIVESIEWANLKPENGLDGGDNSIFIDYNKVVKNKKGKTYEEIYGVEKALLLRRMRSESNSRTKKGKIMSEEQKLKRRHPYGPRSDEFKQKISKISRERSIKRYSCPHCGKESNIRNLKRWHLERCKSLQVGII